MCRLFTPNTKETSLAVSRISGNEPIDDIPAACVCKELQELDSSIKHHVQWDLLRYVVERTYGLRYVHDKTSDTTELARNKHIQGLCVVGVRMINWVHAGQSLRTCNPLLDTDIVSVAEPIVICRVPELRSHKCHGRNIYTPPPTASRIIQQRALNAAIDRADTETGKLEMLQSYAMSAPPIRPEHASWRFLAKYNATTMAAANKTTKPHDTYVCFGCLAVADHYRNQCPRDKESHYVAFDRMVKPVGITSDRLIRVTDPDRLHDPGNMIKWIDDRTVQVFRHIPLPGCVMSLHSK